MQFAKRLLQLLRGSATTPARLYGSGSPGLDELQRRIGYRFADEGLLLRALKHRSYVHTTDENVVESNERLEFLGDAVLSLAVGEYLYRAFPNQPEGELTRLKSAAVSRSALSRKARQIGLGKYVLLSSPERQAQRRIRPSIAGDAYEALLGAIYLDGGLQAVTRFLEPQLLKDIRRLALSKGHWNYKSVLLEHAQKQGKGQPRYIVKSEEGPDHRKTFIVEVAIAGERLGQGMGRSKKQAEQMAARETLKRLGVTTVPQGNAR